MINQGTLREKAREVIRTGKLPNRRPDRTWGGPGGGAYCRICSASVKHEEMELEIEFHRGDQHPALEKYHVHVPCFAAWERERQNIRLDGAAASSGAQGATGDRRSLSEPVDVGNIAGSERHTTYKRGPA